MITQAICDSYKVDIINGVHQPGDTYMIALYTSSATLSKATTAYTSSNEVVGTGYVAGGQALTGYSDTLNTDTAVLSFNNPSWASSTITCAGALIYNASRSNKAVMVLNFGGTVSTSGSTLTLAMPTPGSASGLLQAL